MVVTVTGSAGPFRDVPAGGDHRGDGPWELTLVWEPPLGDTDTDRLWARLDDRLPEPVLLGSPTRTRLRVMWSGPPGPVVMRLFDAVTRSGVRAPSRVTDGEPWAPRWVRGVLVCSDERLDEACRRLRFPAPVGWSGDVPVWAARDVVDWADRVGIPLRDGAPRPVPAEVMDAARRRLATRRWPAPTGPGPRTGPG